MERLQKRSIYGKRKKDKESTAQARKSEGPLNFLSPFFIAGRYKTNIQ